MPIAPGTRIGPYEIQAPLGSGGMGAVYPGADFASAVLTESPTALKETTPPGLRGIIQPANGTHRRRYGKPHLLSVGSVSSRDMHAASFACSHVRVGARRIKRTGREAAEASGEKIASRVRHIKRKARRLVQLA